MHSRRARALSTAALAVYWAALFAATHVPRVPDLPVHVSDKTLHAAAYAILTLLAAFCWSTRRRLGLRQLLMLFALAAFYGAIDELTQIPVGRQAEWFDWVADLAGAACGLFAFATATALWPGARATDR